MPHLTIHFVGSSWRWQVESSLSYVFLSLSSKVLSPTKADCFFLLLWTHCDVYITINSEYRLILLKIYGMVPASIATLGVLIWIQLAHLYLQDQNSSVSCIQCHRVFIYGGIMGLEGKLGTYDPVVLRCFLSQGALSSKVFTKDGWRMVVKLFLLRGICGRDTDIPLPPHPYHFLSASPEMTQCVTGEPEGTKNIWKLVIYFISLICMSWDPWRKSNLFKVSWIVAKADVERADYLTPLLPSVPLYYGLLTEV